jgi:hypothetical protein
MKKTKKGLLGAIIGISLGILFTYIISYLAGKGIIPDYYVTIYMVVNVVLSLITINSMRTAGTLYTVGWLLGALIFKDFLSELDLLLNIAAPSCVLIYRFTKKAKKKLPKLS